MKTKFIFILFTLISFNVLAQSDADNYWILEDFKQFPVENDWNVNEKNYVTYPNSINLTTVHANVEEGFDCAYGQNAMRIRGLEEGGSAEFTVPNASKVTIHVTGKQKAEDRGVIIYRNGTEIKRYAGFDRYDCIEFFEEINSNSPVTYKITSENPSRKDPFVLYYIEVQKFGKDISPIEPPLPDLSKYWVYEDFKNFNIELDYNTTKDYLLNPFDNNIKLMTDSANIELGEGCSGGYENKILRIRGRGFGGGKAEFTVPNAESVSITITGKSNLADRIVEIYRNNELVRKFENMDRSSCMEFLEDINSNEPITYRVEGYGIDWFTGEKTEKPVGIKSVYVKKYNPTGISSIDDNSFNFYPNPAADIIHFNKSILSASIYDMNGRLISTVIDTNEMAVDNLSKGFYIIKITTDEGVKSHKLVKD